MPKYKAINFKDTGKSSGNVYLSEIQGAIGVTVKKEFSCLQLKCGLQAFNDMGAD